MMLEADSELGVISQSLGHTSLHTTEIYLERLSIGKIDKAADSMLDHLVRPAKKKENHTKKRPAIASSIPSTSDLPESSVSSVRSMKKFKAKCKHLISSFLTALLKSLIVVPSKGFPKSGRR